MIAAMSDGIFVGDGMDFQFSSFSFTVDTSTDEILESSMTVKSRLETWDHWLIIAHQNLDLTEVAGWLTVTVPAEHADSPTRS
jgi:hypothetical protein